MSEKYMRRHANARQPRHAIKIFIVQVLSTRATAVDSTESRDINSLFLF